MEATVEEFANDPETEAELAALEAELAALEEGLSDDSADEDASDGSGDDAGGGAGGDCWDEDGNDESSDFEAPELREHGGHDDGGGLQAGRGRRRRSQELMDAATAPSRRRWQEEEGSQGPPLEKVASGATAPPHAASARASAAPSSSAPTPPAALQGAVLAGQSAERASRRGVGSSRERTSGRTVSLGAKSPLELSIDAALAEVSASESSGARKEALLRMSAAARRLSVDRPGDPRLQLPMHGLNMTPIDAMTAMMHEFGYDSPTEDDLAGGDEVAA